MSRTKIINYIVKHDFDDTLFTSKSKYRLYLESLSDDHLSYIFDEVYYINN